MIAARGIIILFRNSLLTGTIQEKFFDGQYPKRHSTFQNDLKRFPKPFNLFCMLHNHCRRNHIRPKIFLALPKRYICNLISSGSKPQSRRDLKVWRNRLGPRCTPLFSQSAPYKRRSNGNLRYHNPAGELARSTIVTPNLFGCSAKVAAHD